MALKLCFLFSIAFCLLFATKITTADIKKVAITLPPVAPPTSPPSPPPPPGPPPSSKLCVGPCWERCHNIKAKNIRPCMILCTRCCMKCDYVITPTCTHWDTVTIEGHTYPCP